MRRLPSAFKFVFAIALIATVQGVAVLAQTADQQTIVKLLRAGGDAVRRGDLAAAESIFKQVIAGAPSLSDGYLGLGLAEMREGKTDEAIHALTRASELNPRLPGAHMFLGITQYQVGLPEPAIDSLRAEVALDPKNGEALTWLGIVELGIGHPEEATGPLDQAVTLRPKDPNVLYYCGRAHMLVAEAVYHRLNDLDPDSAFVHRGLAESYDISGQTEKAIAEYEAAIKKDPVNPDLYEALGEDDQKMGRMDAARIAYEEELTLNPHSAIALYNVGRIDVERGKPESGVATLRLAEAAHSSAAPTDFYLGLGLAELGQNAEAAQWLEKSLANQPSPFVQQGAWYQLARVYQKLNRKSDAQHALEQLKMVLAEQERQKAITAKKAVAQSPGVAPPAQQP